MQEFGMLTLKIKIGEPIQIGDGVYLQVTKKNGTGLGSDVVQLRFVCRKDIYVTRKVDLETIPEQAAQKLGLLNETWTEK